jgi:AmmeMemoRadiSam system protein A
LDSIDPQTGAMLLRFVRRAIERHLTGQPCSDDELAAIRDCAQHGVFITLRKHQRLRGCIGTFLPRAGFSRTLMDIAVAATRDPRFAEEPVALSELADLRIELSLLSPLTRVFDARNFVRGVHGAYLRIGTLTGCFLPDVGLDQGWDTDMFLAELCRRKMNLGPEAWRDERAELYVFTVQKFVEPA